MTTRCVGERRERVQRLKRVKRGKEEYGKSEEKLVIHRRVVENYEKSSRKKVEKKGEKKRKRRDDTIKDPRYIRDPTMYSIPINRLP